ncbi:restriction endonuclease subunit S [Burkholderia territorii]|uniref:restriction endonuclease subunit S n=1 Tax=Burkholderia territorii TaxID=1503055 RepID=UPI000AA96ABD|nr:restriction endonuclease subunit S [Burkholderia territorii]
MSPFNSARYARLLKGLEIAEVQASKVYDLTTTSRLDPEYFQKQHLADDDLLVKRSSDFMSFAELGLTVDASAFYPSIEGYYGQGDFPFLRVADVDSMIDFEGCTRIPEALCDKHPTLARVKPGDLLFTKGGSVGRVGLVSQPAAVSRDLIFLNSSKLPRAEQVFLYLFSQTDFFNRLLLRSSSQTAQPHLTITLVRELKLLRASTALKVQLLAIVNAALKAHEVARKGLTDAENFVLDALNLRYWQAPEPLSYVQSSAEIFAAGRLDAQYFQPKYRAMTEHIDGTGCAKSLENCVTVNQRGKQPVYADEGLPVVNSKHVQRGEVHLDISNRKASYSKDDVLIEFGDVLINGTGVGTIGRSAAYLHADSAVPDNHVTVLRPKSDIDAVFLSVFLNSPAGQWQVEQRLRGSSGQIELYPGDIARFRVWVAPKDIQRKVRRAVEHSFEQKQRSTRLLKSAIQVVNSAIEDSESAALNLLRSIVHAEKIDVPKQMD